MAAKKDPRKKKIEDAQKWAAQVAKWRTGKVFLWLLNFLKRREEYYRQANENLELKPGDRERALVRLHLIREILEFIEEEPDREVDRIRSEIHHEDEKQPLLKEGEDAEAAKTEGEASEETAEETADEPDDAEEDPTFEDALEAALWELDITQAKLEELLPHKVADLADDGREYVLESLCKILDGAEPADLWKGWYEVFPDWKRPKKKSAPANEEPGEEEDAAE